ncbi:hypothetical protein IQ238_07670 [Pleurocapsales cyanobacterium LEGE 06147]|nr:hypothetical protein [Pleurocapsales cyanobacterium LEGE 06147]
MTIVKTKKQSSEESERKLSSSQVQGQLVIIGGAEDKEEECKILREFVRFRHFAQRGRIGRLISALLQQSAALGFGIDENTAIAVKDNKIEIIGEGAVTIIDITNIAHSNEGKSSDNKLLAIYGVKLHILPHGYRFDLVKRKPIF